MENFSDLYTDYLISSTSLTTATGLSTLLKGSVSHDKITRHLSKDNYDSRYLWKRVKPMLEEICSSDDLVVICFDDSIEEKRYTDVSELINWHFDHTINRAVKGVNFLTALIHTKGISLPCAVEFVKKDTILTDAKTGKNKSVSSKTKNEMYREMLRHCNRNINFDYVLNDSWYSSAENMQLVKEELKRNFIMALKSNRKVALSPEDKEQKKYVGIGLLNLEQQPVEVWLEELDFPLLLIKQVFKNEDGTVGELYLVCSDLNLSYEQIATIYKRRWSVEVYHKSVKSNASFAKSPTKIIQTQTNHFILSILAYVKLEWLQLRNQLNHFAMKSKIYICALEAAMKQLKELSTPQNKNVNFA
ncbi:MAG: hypothetical protein EPN85_13085 [Bacteroidetes bacterium]|nr:MAG: hypothetical protein EPN85_13085 [Bacteroidota bacterium]